MHSIGVALIFNLTDLVTGLISAVKAKEVQSCQRQYNSPVGGKPGAAVNLGRLFQI